MNETPEQRQQRLDNNARIEANRQRFSEFWEWFNHRAGYRWSFTNREVDLMHMAWEAGRMFEVGQRHE